MSRNTMQYRNCKAKQFGTLHQRMKYLIGCMQDAGCHNVSNDVWHAAYDLETEVKHYKPETPPFGQRIINEKNR